MNLKSFFKLFSRKKPPTITSNEYLPSFWEDDYCQIEIVPFENKEFILDQTEQIADLANRSKTEFGGFTETFGRGSMPAKTISKEIRVDYLEHALKGFEFQKAKNIRYETKVLDGETRKVKAFGISSFTIFFDIENEFVKNMWVSINLIVSVKDFKNISSALYELGESCELVLIDWNSLELYDLRDKTQVNKYLRGYWK
ncbi:MAG: hypothetical protein NT150_01435 [Bacteroidetes bacterium]|nr:hypothetical protein [Bacteroidota bacterium]